MKTNFALLIFSISSLILFPSCKKDFTQQLTDQALIVVPGTTDTVAVPSPVKYNRTIPLGTGSGNLTINGKTMALQCNDLITIKGGKYESISIDDIVSPDGCPITIKNDGLVELTGDFHLLGIYNMNNVTISGDGTAGIPKGFLFKDNLYRAIEITGSVNNFTMANMSFKNIEDAVITYRNTDLYTGAESSYIKNLKFLNMDCDNTAIFFNGGGYIENGNAYGLVKNIEIANLNFQNSPTVGTVVFLGNVENYDMHHNKINNINTRNNEHNGIFSLSGNGKFHHNYVSNHQGNAIRAFGHTVGTSPKDILIYDNIVVNSRKYSGFEVQAFETSMSAGKTTYTNAIVFNNTCGNLNTSNDWQGVLVDVYNLQGGKCDVYNNLGYNFKPDGRITGQQSVLVPNEFSNLYYASSTQAGLVDQSGFKLSSNSPAKGAGMSTPFIITDYYGSGRAAKPSIGAVE